jgi:hypothetical protein
MLPPPFGYITVIVAQQLCILGLVWYLMHLIDHARCERRLCSTMPLPDAAPNCDLAALDALQSGVAVKQPGPVSHPANVHIEQEEPDEFPTQHAPAFLPHL